MTTMDDVRAHIEWLGDHGMTQRQIARLLGLHDDVISRALAGLRALPPRVMDHVMRISPDDAELAETRAPNADERVEEEYSHFVGRMGWDDATFAAMMADELDLTVASVMTKIHAIQRRRSPVGLSRRDVDLLVGAEFSGDLPRQLVGAARAMEARGFIEAHVWRGKGNTRYAVLTEEGAEALRKERQCQS
ncbi:hypothetical protein [Corynebacterium freneyi]|uniref:HTH cro/C1-type domain-containing protein n=1 Tax=Corynebacterium freneyi TaxID=134034 RepID=A0ABS4U9W5_9CORY|nr:hypothetical protein [Corynebacterium freneyi]MBP2333337.1 hypothetical protein [Corynebacterium freneyi]QXA52612.1 hypothetical protein I6L56_11300 [Corynebacterium freneyi]WJZ04559.1 hypothetical protein CFREN_02865 [Corynebacterium freneyi]